MTYAKILIAVFLLFTVAAKAKDRVDVRSLGENGVSPPAQIESLSWMVGYWEGEGLDGKVAEIVAPPAGGQMMGAFYHMKESGDLNFYEFYTFAEVNDTLVLRIKHFTSGMIGWEEKDDYVEFPLVAIEENAVYFDGLTFAMTAPSKMEAAVNISEQGTAYFSYTRKALE